MRRQSAVREILVCAVVLGLLASGCGDGPAGSVGRPAAAEQGATEQVKYPQVSTYLSKVASDSAERHSKIGGIQIVIYGLRQDLDNTVGAQPFTQCFNAAGTNRTAITTCAQQHAQNLTNPIQSDAAALAHLEGEAQTELDIAFLSASWLGTAWKTEAGQLSHLALPLSALSASLKLRSAYSTLASDCRATERATTGPFDSLEGVALAQVALMSAEMRLARDIQSWDADLARFETEVHSST